MTNKYSFLTGVEKSIFKTIVVVGPLLLGVLPEEWMNITLGAIVTFVINYAKNRPKEEVEDTVSQG
jgi:hypothetical protein